MLPITRIWWDGNPLEDLRRALTAFDPALESASPTSRRRSSAQRYHLRGGLAKRCRFAGISKATTGIEPV
jgi:hypothetical protein